MVSGIHNKLRGEVRWGLTVRSRIQALRKWMQRTFSKIFCLICFCMCGHLSCTTVKRAVVSEPTDDRFFGPRHILAHLRYDLNRDPKLFGPKKSESLRVS